MGLVCVCVCVCVCEEALSNILMTCQSGLWMIHHGTESGVVNVHAETCNAPLFYELLNPDLLHISDPALNSNGLVHQDTEKQLSTILCILQINRLSSPDHSHKDWP